MIIPYFKNIIKGNDKQQFLAKINTISRSLGINANWLMLVINSETGGKFSASIVNPVSGATGLIQFMPTTAEGLFTTTDKLAQMSRIDQLDYVYTYFKRYIDKGYKIKSYEDLYLLTFYPYAVGKPDTFILGSEVSPQRAKLIKQQNPFDSNNDGVLTKGEFKDWIFRSKVMNKIPANQQKQLKSRSNIKVWHIIAGSAFLALSAFLSIKIIA